MSSPFATIRTALGLAALLGGLGLCGGADAQQSKLPECPSFHIFKWNNCFGSYTFPHGERYVGEFQNDKQHGYGSSVLPNGGKYVGFWKDGKSHGKGSYTWPDGQKYVGDFYYDVRDGKGTHTWPHGHKYIGEFQNDKRHGKGTYIWPDGRKYVGDFRESRSHGQGVLFGPTGSVLKKGEWKDDEFVEQDNISLPAPPAASPNPSVAAAPPPPPTPSKASSGTAFRIASGQFVTNHHVINGCTALKVDGNLGGRVVASDAIKDLALVSIANDQGESASIRTTRIQLNESITAAGFPLEGAFSGIAITNGTISRLSGLRGDTGEVQISAPVQPGNSGGPLLDSAGNVIGVVSSKLNALKVAGASGDIPQNVNFAINGSSLRAFLDAKNVNYKEVGNERELTGVQIAARASAFTVLIECQK